MANELQLKSDTDIPAVVDKIDAMLAQAQTIPEINRIEAITAAMQELGRKAGISLHAKNTLTERYIDIRARRGEMLKRLKEEGKLDTGGNPDPVTRSDRVTLSEIGLGRMDSSRDQMLAELPVERRHELSEQADNMAKEFAMSMCLAEVARDRKGVKIEELRKREVAPPTGEYDVIVIDPPWPMEMIEREVRPNQARFDYPTMTEGELRALPIPAAADCHLWTWTTHRFLPMALRLTEAWGFKYVCMFTWHKPGGFQPVGLPQYNCEFAIYARRGTPVFVETKDLPVCFEAPREQHSAKPDLFFQTVRRVTAGQRISMFERKDREGFDSWGNES